MTGSIKKSITANSNNSKLNNGFFTKL